MSRCSYCYTEGHNRRTCPTYTERLQRSADAGSEYYKRELEQRGKGKDKSQRTCSFCNTRGHDRRKCEQLGAYVEKRATLDMDARHDFASRMKEAGLGHGALVTFTRNEYDYDKSEYIDIPLTGVVSEIRWDMLGYSSYDTNSQFITVECIELQSDGTYSALKRHLCLPFDIIAKALKSERDELIKSSRWSRAPVIVSPVDSCNPPRRFFDRKLIERRVRNEAKDLKHWSWQVQELINKPDNS
jgi:hypothetical protein